MKLVSWMRRGAALLLAGGLMTAGAVRAQTIEMTAEFPAANRDVSSLTILRIEPFLGPSGPALARAVERALEGAPFVVVGNDRAREAVATLLGAVRSDVGQAIDAKREMICVARDPRGNCTREEPLSSTCDRWVVAVNAELRIVRHGDNRILYSRAFPMRDEGNSCLNGDNGRTADDGLSRAFRTIASSVRDDIAPHVSTYRVRLRDSSKGMPSDVSREFKETLKSSRSDFPGSCAAWAAMDQAVPGNLSLTYNLGVCAEQRSDYERALALYQSAQRGGAAEGGESVRRTEQLIAGRADAAERARRKQ